MRDFRNTAPVLALLVGLTGVASHGGATSLPESYPLPRAETKPSPIDPALEQWLSEHVERPFALGLNDGDFAALRAKQDALTQVYLDLLRANRRDSAGKGASAKATSDALAASLKMLDDKSPAVRQMVADHPLLPFLYEEILHTKGIAPEASARAMSGLMASGQGSCALKDVLEERVASPTMANSSDEQLLDLLARIDQFRSQGFRRNILRKFLAGLPQDRRDAVGEKLVAMLEASPQLVSQHAWLRELGRSLVERDAAQKKTSPLKSPYAEPWVSFTVVRDQARKKQCAQAKTGLFQALAKIKDPDSAVARASLSDAMTAGKAVDSCYKGRDLKLRRQMWDEALAPFTKAYGMAGTFEVRQRIGYMYWVIDDHERAKPIFDQLKSDAAKSKQGSYEARALYSLARVAEDELQGDLALGYYRDYVTRFVGQENYEDAIVALTMLYDERREFDKALTVLNTYIKIQTAKLVDERAVGGMSFAFFWAGRLHLAKGDSRQASEMWRRGATEYYSTYYGALSHFMLEKVSGKMLALAPARAPAFRMHALRRSFSADDRQKVRRVEQFMRLGMKSEAACELEELATDDARPEKVLVKALMLHASGQWLDAIRAFDSLPRGFRFGLPIGMERLIFPRRYADLVYKYSERAKVDPDLVNAIIRQESVFNPMARSPVGALGLMQLMPATAKLEAKRIQASYLSRDERQALERDIQSTANLLTAESNVAIGVHHVRSLIERYPGPVYVLSAYNASPRAAKRWMETLPAKDTLTFIERIPYRETRAYVKLVLRNYFYYKRWYGPPTGDFEHLAAVTSPMLAMVGKDEVAAQKVGPTPAEVMPISPEAKPTPLTVGAAVESVSDSK